MKKQTIKLNESQLRKLIKESLTEMFAEGTTDNVAIDKWEQVREQILGAKLADKHSKTFDSTFIPTEEPSLQGRNEKGEELFRNNGKYYNSRRGLTTPEKFFKDKEMSDTFNTATQELDNYNNGNYDYSPDNGWHLKESKLNKIIKESIKKVLGEFA